MKSTDSHIAKYHLHKDHPEKLQFELYDLKNYRERSGDKAAKPHSHSYYQIIWFSDSRGKHTVDFDSFDIKEHTILFISKDQIHAFDDAMEIKGWLIHFNESFFMHTDVDIFLKYNIFNSQQNPRYELNTETREIADSYISMLQKELRQRNRFGHEDIIRFLLKSFLINLERIHQKKFETKLELTSGHELTYLKFKDLVEEHYKESWSVKDYASVLNVSPKTLATITKSQSDKSPSFVISERTILQAKRLLKFTALQIGEVGFKIGFEDASYFVKYFKRWVGLSPSAYRKG